MKILDKGIDELLAVIAERAESFRGWEEIGSSDVSIACWDVIDRLGIKREDVTDDEWPLLRNGMNNAIGKLSRG